MKLLDAELKVLDDAELTLDMELSDDIVVEDAELRLDALSAD